MSRSAFLLAATAAALAAPAAAHHGNSAYDMTRETVVEGVVKAFEMGGAHGEIVLVSADARTGVTIEAPPSAILARRGWTNATLKPGDRIVVRLRPNRDGTPGGKAVEITTARGQVVLPRVGPPFG
jgi:hypothetical protein